METTDNAKASATTSELSLLRLSFRGENNQRERDIKDLASDLPGLNSIKEFWGSEEVTKCFLSAVEGLSGEMLKLCSHLCMAHSFS